ncbi:hypothetical protein [Alteromonas stellipolaris]|uniref:Pilin accessory protein (PilO) n=1 Tax=Alteromonas stellipolaris TaxID=233316 RepID=A0ABN4LU55_9ALTE|nr:hypothetical protein AVL57_00940 [Alteromonas stellipolaris]
MRVIELQDKEIVWVINPIRTKVSDRDLVRAVEKYLDKRSAIYASATRINSTAWIASADFEQRHLKKAFDFAAFVKGHMSPNGVAVYIEPVHLTSEVEGKNYCFVCLQDGEIILDKVLNRQDIVDELRMLRDEAQHLQSRGNDVKSTLSFYSCEEDFNEALKDFPNAKIESLDTSWLNSLEPTSAYGFVKSSKIREMVMPRNISLRLLPIVGGVIGVALLLAWVGGAFEKPIEVKRVKDEWASYRTFTEKKAPQLSNRIAQDYNNLRAFDATLTGWHVAEVKHSKSQDIIYRLINDGGYTADLNKTVDTISKKFGIAMLMDYTRQGSIITSRGANTPMFKESQSERWNLRTLYQTFDDDLKVLGTNVSLTFTNFESPDPTSKKWRAIKGQIILDRAPLDTLLLITAAAKNKPISIVSGNYQTSEGWISGNYTIVMYGEDQW